MYELEIAHDSDRIIEVLTPEQKASFRDEGADILGVSLIPWEEHCTECAMPACFATCDLYDARPDGKCRRFKYGIEPVFGVPSLLGYIVRISFKRWAQLMAYANTHLLPLSRAGSVIGAVARIDGWVANMPGGGVTIAGRKNVPARMQRRLKQWAAREGVFADRSLRPDYFLVEILNPTDIPCRLTLKLLSPDPQRKAMPYQELLNVAPGFNRFKFDCRGIFARVDPQAEIHITLTPNVAEDDDRQLTLYFGSIGFVADRKYAGAQPLPAPASGEKKSSAVKVVVWDLDNTVWQGVLIEDGPEGIRLKPGIEEVIRTLDARGIVNSIASKNDPEHAMQQLARFGLAEYFVFSRIGWGPKGEAIKAIIKDFNVGADTVVFVDDQPFERDQVSQVEPKVLTLDATEYLDILGRPAFNPPLSAESAGRREFYLTQHQRSAALEGFSGDYLEFLRECRIELEVIEAKPTLGARLHELVQRTNQLNFSGRRYTREEIDALLADPRYDRFALSCRDRYGEYGVIGFCLVDKSGQVPVLRDLMLSCRVQSKRVEHAFLAHLMEKYRSEGYPAFEAIYRKTQRNEPAGRVFAEVGFTEVAAVDDVITYRYSLAGEIPRVDVISIKQAAST